MFRFRDGENWVVRERNFRRRRKDEIAAAIDVEGGKRGRMTLLSVCFVGMCQRLDNERESRQTLDTEDSGSVSFSQICCEMKKLVRAALLPVKHTHTQREAAAEE